MTRTSGFGFLLYCNRAAVIFLKKLSMTRSTFYSTYIGSVRHSRSLLMTSKKS